jgi:hypothetical protein
VRAAEETHIWPDEGARSNGDGACVEKSAIEVDKHVAADFDIGSVVNVDRSFNPGIFMENCVLFFVC